MNYIDGNRSGFVDHAKNGNGSQIAWTDLAPEYSYSVKLETVDCGSYDMQGSISINELEQSSAPEVISNLRPLQKVGGRE